VGTDSREENASKNESRVRLDQKQSPTDVVFIPAVFKDDGRRATRGFGVGNKKAPAIAGAFETSETDQVSTDLSTWRRQDRPS
jgi:hypothetical protein